LKIPGIHVKNRVFYGHLQHKALVEISRKNKREHNFVSIKIIFFEKKDLGVKYILYLEYILNEKNAKKRQKRQKILLYNL
jgi:hypothetical protein